MTSRKKTSHEPLAKGPRVHWLAIRKVNGVVHWNPAVWFSSKRAANEYVAAQAPHPIVILRATVVV